jgi:mono/diheme cytochrome c family protein
MGHAQTVMSTGFLSPLIDRRFLMNKENGVPRFGGAMVGVVLSVALLAASGGAIAFDAANPHMAQATKPRIVMGQGIKRPTAPIEAPTPTVSDGEARPATYSAEQADRGEQNFMRYCAECHGENLRGGLLGGPPLRGQAFEEKFANGEMAGVLFDFMSATMPPDSPGRFSATDYANLMAFIMKGNGFQAGAPLPSDSDALYDLILEK